MVASTGLPAGIIIMIRRGFSNAAVNASNVVVPSNAVPGCSSMKSFTHSGSRFQTATR